MIKGGLREERKPGRRRKRRKIPERKVIANRNTRDKKMQMKETERKERARGRLSTTVAGRTGWREESGGERNLASEPVYLMWALCKCQIDCESGLCDIKAFKWRPCQMCL